jgi:hypothetical protein
MTEHRLIKRNCDIDDKQDTRNLKHSEVNDPSTRAVKLTVNESKLAESAAAATLALNDLKIIPLNRRRFSATAPVGHVIVTCHAYEGEFCL